MARMLSSMPTHRRPHDDPRSEWLVQAPDDAATRGDLRVSRQTEVNDVDLSPSR
jgi:hypothetical protein